LNFGVLGYVIVGIFLLVWGVSAALWKFKRIEERHDALITPHAHEHTHPGGVIHVHKHFH
jgi:hypothetical protein